MTISNYKQILIDSKHLIKEDSHIARSAELLAAEQEGEEKYGIDGDNSTAEFERYYDFVIEKLGLEPALEQPQPASVAKLTAAR
jgi:hypothetical protein